MNEEPISLDISKFGYPSINDKKFLSLTKFNNTTYKLGTGGISKYLINLDNNISERLSIKQNEGKLNMKEFILNKDKASFNSSKRDKFMIKDKSLEEISQGGVTNRQFHITDKNFKFGTHMLNTLNYLPTLESRLQTEENKRGSLNPINEFTKETKENKVKSLMDSELNNEFGKLVVKPNNLLRTTDKAFHKLKITNANV